MATEDVIELGSSDEEAEPAPKKTKNIPKNAMVHIPSTLPELTIKSTKGKNVSIPVKSSGKKPQPIPVKSSGKKPQPARQEKARNLPVKVLNAGPLPAIRRVAPRAPLQVNGKPVLRLAGPVRLPFSPPAIPIRALNKGSLINPINVVNKLNPQLKVRNLASIRQVNPLQSPKVLNSKSLTKLPPDITITKTSTGKRPTTSQAMGVKKKQKRNTQIAKTVETVNLDDDETPQSLTSSRAWYLRPEEQNETKEDPKESLKEIEISIENKNNAEPTPSNMVEITIEDSPIKQIKNKRTHEVGAELAITIDDSPVKGVVEKDPLMSDGEHPDKEESSPKSRKKLNYPKETEVHTIEIEIAPMEYDEPTASTAEKVNENNGKSNDQIVEIFESPAKPIQDMPKINEVKKDNSKKKKPEIAVPNFDESDKQTSDSEFHPIYQKFINLCLSLENSDDMRKIVDKKIKAYYKQVPNEYTGSEDFLDMVSSKIVSIQANPEKMYLYIKDIVDELNLQRKIAKYQPPPGPETTNTVSEKFQFPENSEFDAKRQRQIRKLEKTIKKLHRAIQKLEDQEVDFDDEEDSVYLLTERYKERMVRVHAKFCQLTNTKLPSEPRVVIDARPGQPAGPAKRLEKWVNRKVPIGTPLPFPDFHDVLRCVREANEEDKLGWNEVDMMEEARDLFVRCGKKLQRRRQENEWRLVASRLPVDIDPAEKNSELKQKLEDNKQVAFKKETEVFNKFADRQSQLKLEAEEIGDREAEESPVEDDDEEEPTEEISSLQDKEKRKEKLRQLIQVKKKKSAEEKENESKETDNNQVSNKIEEHDDKQEKDIEKEDSVDKKVKEKESIDDENKKEGEEKVKSDGVHSVSDDSSKIESDIDELHLLQKLHSENEMNPSTIESDTSVSSPVDISDTLSSDNKEKNTNDVISIENSSYSESEVNKDLDDNNEEEILPTTASTSALGDTSVVSDNQTESHVLQTSNDEYNTPIGEILLASSEDELDKNENAENEDISMNLQDDDISIGDTIVQDTRKRKKSVDSQDGDENIVKDDSQPLVQDENTILCNDDGVDSEEETAPQNGIAVTLDKISDECLPAVDEIPAETDAKIEKGDEKDRNLINDVTEITDSNSPELVDEESKDTKIDQESTEISETENNKEKNVINEVSEITDSNSPEVVDEESKDTKIDQESTEISEIENKKERNVINEVTEITDSNSPEVVDEKSKDTNVDQENIEISGTENLKERNVINEVTETPTLIVSKSVYKETKDSKVDQEKIEISGAENIKDRNVINEVTEITDTNSPEMVNEELKDTKVDQEKTEISGAENIQNKNVMNEITEITDSNSPEMVNDESKDSKVDTEKMEISVTENIVNNVTDNHKDIEKDVPHSNNEAKETDSIEPAETAQSNRASSDSAELNSNNKSKDNFNEIKDTTETEDSLDALLKELGS